MHLPNLPWLVFISFAVVGCARVPAIPEGATQELTPSVEANDAPPSPTHSAPTHAPTGHTPTPGSQATHGIERLSVRFALEASGVQDAVWSPDSAMLAVASEDGVYMFDIAHQQELWFRKSEDIIFSVSFAPDGSIVASAGFTDGFQLWESASARLAGGLVRGSGLFGGSSIEFSRNGRMVATGATYPLGHEGPWTDLELWDFESRASLKQLEAQEGVLGSLAFNASDSMLAVGILDREVTIWDVASGNLETTLPGGVAAFAPVTDRIAVGGVGRVSLLDPEDYHLLLTMDGSIDTIRSIAFSPHRDLLAASGEGVGIWSIETVSYLRRIPGVSGLDITFVAFSPDGRFMTTFELHDEAVTVWGLTP